MWNIFRPISFRLAVSLALIVYLAALTCSGVVALGGKIGISVLRWDDGRPFGVWLDADAIHFWWTKVKPTAYSWQYIPDDPPTFLDHVFLLPVQNGVDASVGGWSALWQEGHMTVEDAFGGKSYRSPAVGVQTTMPFFARIVFACLITIGCVGITRRLWTKAIFGAVTPKELRLPLSGRVLPLVFICSLVFLAATSAAWRGAASIQPHFWFVGRSRSVGVVANYSSIASWKLDSSVGRDNLFDRTGIPGPSSGEGFDSHPELIIIAQHHWGSGSVCSLATGQFDNRENPMSVSPPVGRVAEVAYWVPENSTVVDCRGLIRGDADPKTSLTPEAHQRTMRLLRT
jgi:hypothetical protein